MPENDIKNFVRPEGGYGWIIVAACITINATLLPLVQLFGIIYKDVFKDYHISAAQISFLLHLNNSIMCSLGLLSGPLLKRFNYRQVAAIGFTFMWCGIFLTTFAKSYIAFIFTVGVLQGIGHGILMPATYLAVNSYFKKRLTLAISFQVTGVSIFPIFMPHVCNYLLQSVGTSGTVLLLSGVALHSIPAIMLLKPIEKKQQVKSFEKVLDNLNKSEELECELLTEKVYRETTIKNKKESSSLRNILSLDLFKNKVYVILVIGMSLTFVSELNIILMIPFVLNELASFTNDDLAYALSIQAIFDVAGRLFVPAVAHAAGWPPKIMYICSLICSSIGRTGIAMFYCSTNLVFTSCAIIGLAKGVKAVFQSLILPKYIEFDKLAAATGLSMVINGILSLTMGPLIGFTHDISNSYVYPLHTATFISFICIVLWSVDDLFKSKNESKDVDNEEGKTGDK